MSATNEIATQEPKPVATAPATTEAAQFIAVIERAASNPDVDVDKMERLLTMQERVLNRNAEQAFNAALAQMQSELPTIAETSQGHNTKYAPLEKINQVVRPILQAHGFAITFRTKQIQGGVEITAVLSHREGHHEETSLTLPADTSGNKNAVQAIGSTISYGKRYALCALLNISTGDDTDGVPPQTTVDYVSAGQVKQLANAIDMAGMDEAGFCRQAGISCLENLEAVRFERAMAHLKQKAQGGR